MISKLLLIVTLAFTAHHSLAKQNRKPNSHRKPSQAQLTNTILIYSVFGDKYTQYQISKTPKGAELQFNDNEGLKLVRAMSLDDFAYLISKLGALKGPSNDVKFCLRRHIQISYGEKSWRGCIGSQTPVAKGIIEVTNLLSLLL